MNNKFTHWEWWQWVVGDVLMRKENLHAAVCCVLRKVVESLYYGTTLIPKTWEALTTIYEGHGRARSLNRSAPKIPRIVRKKMRIDRKKPNAVRGKILWRIPWQSEDACKRERVRYTFERNAFYHTAISLLSKMQPGKSNFHSDFPERFVNQPSRLLVLAVE